MKYEQLEKLALANFPVSDEERLYRVNDRKNPYIVNEKTMNVNKAFRFEPSTLTCSVTAIPLNMTHIDDNQYVKAVLKSWYMLEENRLDEIMTGLQDIPAILLEKRNEIESIKDDTERKAAKAKLDEVVAIFDEYKARLQLAVSFVRVMREKYTALTTNRMNLFTDSVARILYGATLNADIDTNIAQVMSQLKETEKDVNIKNNGTDKENVTTHNLKSLRKALTDFIQYVWQSSIDTNCGVLEYVPHINATQTVDIYRLYLKDRGKGRNASAITTTYANKQDVCAKVLYTLMMYLQAQAQAEQKTEQDEKAA